MTRMFHSAGNTGSRIGDKALAVACLFGGILGTAILPGPGRASVIIGANAARDTWNKADNNYHYWHCSKCPTDVRINE
jgi:hypothetical protein